MILKLFVLGKNFIQQLDSSLVVHTRSKTIYMIRISRIFKK